MKLTHAFVNVAAFDGTGQPAHEIITKSPKERWIVAASPVAFDKPVDWSPVVKEEHVYIPLVPYLMPQEMASALGFMLQLGVRLATNINVPVLRLHLSIGTPLHEVSDEQGSFWQYQVGFGLQIK